MAMIGDLLSDLTSSEAPQSETAPPPEETATVDESMRPDEAPISGRKQFGTFGGVFTPTVLTILGVIMYLREGWIIGNAGLLGAQSCFNRADEIGKGDFRIRQSANLRFFLQAGQVLLKSSADFRVIFGGYLLVVFNALSKRHHWDQKH